MFFYFLSQIVVAAPLGLDICYYLDKAKPGNQERPDHARSSQCIYWSCLQFPSWFRSRRNGWIPFAYVNVAEQLEADLTDSMLVRFLVRTFDSSVSELAFSKGFTLRSHDGRSIVVRLRRQLTVADWEQHVKTMSLKGYNGSVPCGICRNVLGRCPFFENDPDFVHLHSSEHEKFDKHTPESFAQLAAELKDVAQNRPGELADHEQASGLKYDPYAVPWDDEVRAKLAPPLNHFPDWMHTFPGSGGLAQYNVNAFVLQLSDYDISAEDIDLWCRDVHLPLSMTRLSKTFFRDRIVQRAGAHMRAFASEVLTAFVLLVFLSIASCGPWPTKLCNLLWIVSIFSDSFWLSFAAASQRRSPHSATQ